MNCLKIATFVAFLAFFSPSVDACGSTQQKFDEWIRENQKEDEQGNPVKKPRTFPTKKTKKFRRILLLARMLIATKNIFSWFINAILFFYSFLKPNVCVKCRFAGN